MFSHFEQLEKLESDKMALEVKIRAIEDDLRKGLNRNRLDQSVQLENYEVLLEILRVAESELNEINDQIYHIETSSHQVRG